MSLTRSVLAALIFIVGYSLSAQDLTLPEAPSSHKFLDRQNTIAFASLAGLVAADAVLTQRLTNSGVAHEANPLWRPLVKQGWPGEMAASALGYGAALGTAYTLHRTGHHKMERWANWVTAAIEAGNVGHSFSVAVSH
jgi:hypothetical protein